MGRSNVLSLGTSLSPILANTSGSSYKVVTLVLTNVGDSMATVKVAIERAGMEYYILKDHKIPATKTVSVFLSKDVAVYLEDGDSLLASADAAMKVTALCSYEGNFPVNPSSSSSSSSATSSSSSSSIISSSSSAAASSSSSTAVSSSSSATVSSSSSATVSSSSSATVSSSSSTAVSSSSSSRINSANFNYCADWNGQNGNVTTVGSNGGASYYNTFDQSGNVFEWNDLDGTPGSTRGVWGGSYNAVTNGLSSSGGATVVPAFEFAYYGFRLASVSNILALDNFVTVGDAGNSNDNTGYGQVSYPYHIGKYTVTNCEYVEFLNAIAKTDTYGVYNLNMTSDPRGGIIRSGSPGSYIYSVKPNMNNKPVNYVSWFDAARYCNWLHNNKPTRDQDNSTTEDGAYLLNGTITGNAVAKKSNAKYHIPTENEWYKAAYYSPIKGGIGNPGYYAYATQSDVAPTCVPANSVGDGDARTSDYVCPSRSSSSSSGSSSSATSSSSSRTSSSSSSSTASVLRTYTRSAANPTSSDMNWGVLRGVIQQNIPNWGNS